MALAIGVDIGGTKVAGGVVDGGGRVLAETRRATPSDDADAALDAVVEVVRELRAECDVAAVGVAAAGYVSADRTTMLFAPNLPWADVPVRDRVAEAVDLPVVVENDANAAAWAESRFGAGRGEPDLVCLTVGTGIGAGIVVDGELYRGRFGIAGEPGHLTVVPDGIPCGCGNAGCLEQYASGTALVRYAKARGLDSDGPAIADAARDGDERAVAAFAEVGEWLGRGLANVATVLDPGLFVVGGGVADAGALLLDPARASFARHLSGAAHRPHADVRPAALGNAAGLVGAADLARR
ncbi:MAG TPA: ROK family glucokinase [Mycobacteriales bacterium]|jgi:glucokinase|nr:ROK family glucokinase [Mycobacteriales bacterium]